MEGDSGTCGISLAVWTSGHCPTRACSGRGPLRSCAPGALPSRVAGHAADAWDVRRPNQRMGMSISLIGRTTLDEQRASDLRVLAAAIKHGPLDLGTVVAPEEYAEPFTEALGSYSNILHLQLLACQMSAGAIPSEPVRDRGEVSRQLAELKRSCALRHLVAPWEGRTYYLPIDFDQPVSKIPTNAGWRRLFTRDSCSAGSSIRLLEELNELNAILRVSGDAGEVGMDAVLDRTENDLWGAEKYAWAVLRWFARESTKQKGVIRFS
jgi:hypothetical protein